ncbi:MAG TPA: polysaccharide deacetylase family protein [bacterium]|nr:polysaccharide deacetylase family protein [bacterium]
MKTKFVDNTLTFWFGRNIDIKDKIDYDTIFNKFLKPKIINKDIYARRLGFFFTSKLNERQRYVFTSLAKILRGLVYYKELIKVEDTFFVRLKNEIEEKTKYKFDLWTEKKVSGVIAITHDLDSKECYDFLPKILKLEKKYGIISSTNFLTNWGYKVDKQLLEDMTKDGFEVGLHGWTHDVTLGFKNSKKPMREHIKKALEELNFKVKGYRAPAFAVSSDLIEVLDEFGIRYDSSLKLIDHISSFSECCYPYKYYNTNVWEIPLTIQDDRVFRDKKLNAEEGLGIVKEICERVIKNNGVVVINLHPRLLKNKMDFFEDLLKWIKDKENVWQCALGELVDYLDLRWEKVINTKKV